MKAKREEDIPLRYLRAEETLSEAEVLERYRATADCPFPPLWETLPPGPGQTLACSYLLAQYRIIHAVGPQMALLCDHPAVGLAAVWRIWGDRLQVVQGTERDCRIRFIPGVVTLTAEQSLAVRWIVDRIPVGPLPWHPVREKGNTNE